MKMPRILMACAVLLVPGVNLSLIIGQPAAPPPPARYQIVLRYRIAAARDQHVLRYDAMIQHLRAVGFAFNPPLEKMPQTDREDRTKDYLRGTIASNKVLKLLGNPSVAALLVMPEEFEYPSKDLDKRVRVQLELAGGFDADRQRELAEQVRAILAVLDFREAPSYDHHGHSGRAFTRLAGMIPQGRLEVLLKDLRGQPAGWFTSIIAPHDIPSPLRNVNPIQIIEVLSDAEPIAEITLPGPRFPEYLEKISPDLWAKVEDKDQQNFAVRVELIFSGTLTSEDQNWLRVIQEAAPGLFVEGQLGQVVSAVVRLGQVKSLAILPSISTIRLQRPVRVDVDPNTTQSGDNAKALSLTGLKTLHEKGYLGQGVRLAILDTDFSGWEQMVKQKKLPTSARIVDLTTELDPDLYTAPSGDVLGSLGHGTVCAMAAALAAPQTEMVLIRIDASSPYQLVEVLGYMRGTNQSSPYVDLRRDELVTARAQLNLLRSQVLQERRVILENYIDETDLQRDFGFLGPVYGWIFSPRTWSLDRLAYTDKLEKILSERSRRFFKLIESIRSLEGIGIVANSLVWNDGFTLGGASPLSRAFERLLQPPPCKPGGVAKSPLLWFQAVGNTRGQSWAGLFRDQDGNGFMEFSAPDYQLKKGQWTTELNFLEWKPFDKESTPDLPEGARIRISLQWREPHDADYFMLPGDADLYRKPLADLGLSLLRQHDPSHKTLPADAFDLVAVSSGIPQRLENQPGGAIYEVVLETTLEKAGRYALRVERPTGQQWLIGKDADQKRLSFVHLGGLRPSGLRPLGVVTLPALEKQWDLQPRLFVDVVGPQKLLGRPVLENFSTDQGSVGLPGDARTVISVGAADWQNQPRPYSAGGPLPFAELTKKPSVLAYDGLQLINQGTGPAFGTSVATSFAAGSVVTMISAGMSPETALVYINQLDGKILQAPAKN